MYTFMCNIIPDNMYTIVQYQLEQLHKNIPTARVSNNNALGEYVRHCRTIAMAPKGLCVHTDMAFHGGRNSILLTVA